MFDFFINENKKKDIIINGVNISDGYRHRRQPIENRLSMDKYYREDIREQIALKASDESILDKVFSSLDAKQVEFIKTEIKESEGGHHFEILNEKPDLEIEYQKDNENSFNTYVSQWNDYPCEDCYSGYVYVELEENKKYLKWSYSM